MKKHILPILSILALLTEQVPAADAVEECTPAPEGKQSEFTTPGTGRMNSEFQEIPLTPMGIQTVEKARKPNAAMDLNASVIMDPVKMNDLEKEEQRATITHSNSDSFNEVTPNVDEVTLNSKIGCCCFGSK